MERARASLYAFGSVPSSGGAVTRQTDFGGRHMDGFGKLVSAALVALGLGFAGFSIGKGFVDARQLDRSVEVKGLAERDVTADTAIWPL